MEHRKGTGRRNLVDMTLPNWAKFSKLRNGIDVGDGPRTRKKAQRLKSESRRRDEDLYTRHPPFFPPSESSCTTAPSMSFSTRHISFPHCRRGSRYRIGCCQGDEAQSPRSRANLEAEPVRLSQICERNGQCAAALARSSQRKSTHSVQTPLAPA